MSNLYKTARGATVDVDRLKLVNETTIAVGNSSTNARGDLVKGNKIVKTREQIAQEIYNISGNNIVKKSRVKDNESDIEPDDITTANSVSQQSPANNSEIKDN